MVTPIEAGGVPTATTPSQGPALLHLDEGGIPQGQGVDARTQDLLTTYVFEPPNTSGEDNEVRLSVQGLSDGIESAYVTLGDEDGNIGSASPHKGGGVAVDGDLVYVADTTEIYVYSRSELASAAERGAVAQALDVIDLPEGTTASYLQVSDGKLYVGEFMTRADGLDTQVRIEGPGERAGDLLDSLNPFQNPFDRAGDAADSLSPVEFDVERRYPEMVVYSLRTDDGAPLDYGALEELERFDIPYETQGVAVTSEGLLFSRSHGSTQLPGWLGGASVSPHELVFQAHGDGPGDARHAATIDYYAEGINIVGNEVWVTYESNADAYAGKYEDNTGQAPDNTHVERIPIDALELNPETLGLDDGG